MRHLRDHAQIMGDQQNRHAHLLLQSAQQVEHLGLNGHVERRGRLVCNQQAGLAGERDRDHDALFHAPGELERILVHPALRIGQSHRIEQFEYPGIDSATAQIRMLQQHLPDLHADRHDRIETGTGLLKDHADSAAAHIAHGRFRELQQVLAVQAHGTRQYLTGIRQQARNRQRRHGFAATRLAQQRKGLAAAHRKRHAVHRAHHALAARQPGAQILDLQNGGRHGHLTTGRRR